MNDAFCYIDSFGFSNYKSFGLEPQFFPSTKKINLIIGRNNSGKSNVLRYLTHHYSKMVEACRNRKAYGGASDVDNHLSSHQIGTRVRKFCVGMRTSESELEDYIARISERKGSQFLNLTRLLLTSSAMGGNEGTVWFHYDSTSGNMILTKPSVPDFLKNSRPLNRGEWESLWKELRGGVGGDLEKVWIPEILQTFSPVQWAKQPTVTLIPAIREVRDGSEDTEGDFSGLNLIEKLAKLESPSYLEQKLKQQFEEINHFVRNVTENSSARLEIPYARDTIHVSLNDLILPLHSLGTGIHEVIILAAAATVLQNQVICIEEPEIHLHPGLQRKLIHYLYNYTSNQYFIATHSAHLLDAVDASVYHVDLQDGHSVVRLANTDKQRSEVCFDLGYRASDILQSNCIIWVEGPSDRIYLRHWLAGIAPELDEGCHYSIMFYGGRLLSHLSADDPEVDDFISLRRLNRNIAILIDSDRSKAMQALNDTKKRLRKEFDEGPGFAWITKGREIENYIAADRIESAIREVHRDVKEVLPSSDYDHRLQYKNKKGEVKTADKVKIAHWIAKGEVDFEPLDLKHMINKLVKFIKQANGETP